jgi:hypothetical protein
LPLLHLLTRRDQAPGQDGLFIADHWTHGMRAELVRTAMRTKWLHSEYNPTPLLPEGRTRHACSRRD